MCEKGIKNGTMYNTMVQYIIQWLQWLLSRADIKNELGRYLTFFLVEVTYLKWQGIFF